MTASDFTINELEVLILTFRPYGGESARQKLLAARREMRVDSEIKDDRDMPLFVEETAAPVEGLK